MELGPAPPHLAEFNAENPFAAADEFVDQVRQDARADVAVGKPIKDAALIARGFDEHDKSNRGGKESGKSRSGPDSKKAFILAEAAQLKHLPRATLVNTVVKRYAAHTKHKDKVTPKYVRDVLAKK